MCAFYDNKCKQIWKFCGCCCKSSSPKIYNDAESSSQDQQIGPIPERGLSEASVQQSVGIGRFSGEATSVPALREQAELRSENEHAVNVFAELSKEKDDFNARKMRKTLHEIRNFRTLDATTIKCIRRLNDADKMRIIIAYNDVVNSMQLIFESLLN